MGGAALNLGNGSPMLTGSLSFGLPKLRQTFTALPFEVSGCARGSNPSKIDADGEAETNGERQSKSIAFLEYSAF